MEYRVIDRNNWQRKEYFEHYLKKVPCTYSITTKLDITAIKKQRLKLSCAAVDSHARLC